MENPKSFHIEPLQEMVSVGSIQAKSARLWIRSDMPGILQLCWWKYGEQNNIQKEQIVIENKNKKDNTCSIEIPSINTNKFLEPLTRYVYEVRYAADNHLIGQGSFETAPENVEQTPNHFSIALMSCNQPFDEDGLICQEAIQMLRATKKCLQRHDTKFVLMGGDQMYSDLPRSLSLFNPDYFSTIATANRKSILECGSEEIRRIFHHRYRYFWNLPELKVIHAEYPCYPIWDDHDLIDNWGSDPEHQEEKWQAFFKGAKSAYFDYQGSCVIPPEQELPESFDYNFTYGNTATYILDLRSNRTAGENGQLFSENQERNIRKFLQTHTDKKVLFFVLSVPVIHLPRFLAKLAAKITHSGEDFSDRWSSGAHIRDRDRFLKMIHKHQLAHPGQKIILLSGDIHIGCVHQIQWHTEEPSLYQVISSPLTHINPFFVQFFSKLLIRMNYKMSTNDSLLDAKIRLFKGLNKYNRNPYGGLNLSLVEIETPQSGVEPKVRFYLYGHQGEEPVCVYRSPYI